MLWLPESCFLFGGISLLLDDSTCERLLLYVINKSNSCLHMYLILLMYLVRFACVWSTSRDIPYYKLSHVTLLTKGTGK
jgi:hypothetical protein